MKLHSMVNYFNSKFKLKFALNFITQSLGPFVFFFLNNCTEACKGHSRCDLIKEEKKNLELNARCEIKKCEMRDKKCEMRDKIARCEIKMRDKNARCEIKMGDAR